MCLCATVFHLPQLQFYFALVLYFFNSSLMRSSFIACICILFFALLSSCTRVEEEPTEQPFVPTPGEFDYRQEMREFVIRLSQYAETIHPNFIVIPQNGQELCSLNGAPDGPLASEYLQAIDGQGREDFFYGYNNDDEATPVEERDLWQPFLEVMRDNDVKILVTDYCSTPSYMDDSYAQNAALDFISYAADARDLNTIATYPMQPYNENDGVITSLSDAQNFLYLINTDNYGTKQEFIDAVTATNYDAILMDYFFDEEEFTSAEILELKQKANGGERLVISYMSVGEAEDYRYYWLPYWSFNPPDWMGGVNPDWPGNYKIDYWNSEWQNIIYGNDESYLKKILNKGFDGVYLDLIDAFEYWEE